MKEFSHKPIHSDSSARKTKKATGDLLLWHTYPWYLSFELLRYLHKQISDREMLWADSFALAAFNAFRCLAIVERQDTVVIIIRVPIAECLLCIVVGEHVGNEDFLWTAAFFDAISTGCAWDHVHALEHIVHLFDSRHFFLIERLKINHVRDIVFHLFQCAHAR